MRWLLAAGLVALLEAGAVAVAEPVTPPPAQTSAQGTDTSGSGRIMRGRWQRNGRTFRHKQWQCRMVEGRKSCRWRYW